MSTLQELLDKSKEFELITIERDPLYDKIVNAIKIVRAFVRKFGLILLGGSALDFALRLKGDFIYPDEMLNVPDLDMYSPNSVEHAYILVDILYRAGYTEARAIVARHSSTTRVDVASNHFVADISYCPEEIFKTIPTLDYNGLRIISPTAQRLDIHSSLSFPYDDPGLEVIFARWKKDIKRFNKVNANYPIEIDKPIFKSNDVERITLPSNYHKYIFGGMIAYSMIYAYYCDQMRKNTLEPKVFIDGIDGTININNLDFMLNIIAIPTKTIDIITTDTDKIIEDLKLRDVRRFEKYLNMMPTKSISKIVDTDIIIYDIGARLLSINSIEFGNVTFRIANVQYILHYFISRSLTDKDERMREICKYCYNSLLQMISDLAPFPTENSPLNLSINTYGSKNISDVYEINLNRMLSDIKLGRQLGLPLNYYAERNIPKGLPHPKFDYSSSEFFKLSGKEIIIDKKE